MSMYMVKIFLIKYFTWSYTLFGGQAKLNRDYRENTESMLNLLIYYAKNIHKMEAINGDS